MSRTGIVTPYLTLRYVVRSGFLNTYRAEATLIVNFKRLFQLGVLRFCGDEDGDVGIGVFPQREEIFVGGECANAGGIGISSLRGSPCKGLARAVPGRTESYGKSTSRA